jgi:L-histidine Nalpha-methyltransferase
VARPRLDVFVDAHTRRKWMAEDVVHGLTSRPKSLPPKYFYDVTGSRLFDEITRLPEYYLTRTEEALLAQAAPALMQTLRPRDVVELGSGFSQKTRRLLEARDGDRPPLRYTPVEIDAETVVEAAAELTARHPEVEVHGVIGDFERHLVHVPPPLGPRLALFLGSTIGNLHPPERLSVLAAIRDLLLPDGHLLLGVDLVKDRAVLEAAYDDAAGVTREFNRNVLRVVNRGLDGDFRPEAFRHHAWYNATESRIEMHLVAGTRQTVRLRRVDLTVHVEPGESIWTESSYKFTRASVEASLREAGLGLARWITDDDERFALAVATPLPRG